MRFLGRWLASLACAALLAIVAPALADDVVAVTADQPTRIGSLVLEPGSYLLHSDSSMGTRNVLMVTSLDEKKFVGYVFANFDCCRELKAPVDRLELDEAGVRTLRSWTVAWRGAAYYFSPSPVSPAMAARVPARAGTRVATR